MLRNYFLFITIGLSFNPNLNAQKKAIDHTIYDSWNDLKKSEISRDGKWLGYIIEPQVGDGRFFLRNNQDESEQSMNRVSRYEFGPENNYVIGRIDPGYDTVRKLKLADVKFSKLPKDSIFVWYLGSEDIVKIPKYSSYSVPDSGYFLVYKQDESSWEAPKKRKCIFRKKETSKESSRGNDLTVLNTNTRESKKILNVTDYELSKNGQWLGYVTQLKKDTTDYYKVYLLNLQTEEETLMFEANELTTSLNNIDLSPTGKFLSFFASSDTAKNKVYDMYLMRNSGNRDTMIVRGADITRHENWSPSIHQSIRFSDNEKRCYFGIAPNPYNAPKDTLLSSEKYKVDIWHWQDKRLQPRQLLEKKRDEKQTLTCVYHLDENRFVELGDMTMDYVSVNYQKNHGKVLASSADKYSRSYDWSMPWLRTYYLIDESDGDVEMLKDSIGYGLSMSPEGQYASYFNHKDSTWYVINLSNMETQKASGGIEDPLASDNNGSPYESGGFGDAGWLEGDESFWFNSEHHVWSFDPKKSTEASCVSCEGEDDQVYRYIHWDSEQQHIDAGSATYFSVYNEKTKASGIAMSPGSRGFTTLYLPDASVGGFRKAKNSDEVIFRQMTFKDYPDLYLSKLTFDSPKRITMTNPQQKDFKWGEVQLVNWTSYKGLELEGLLYTPEDLDSTKKYPMIVYFYEKYDKSFHTHYVPKPTASIVYPTEYVSNDYIVFIPNIEYLVGHPGKSAYDCILSGTDYLTQKYDWIDTTKMGLQGQSWGGYQTAYLVTQTDKYAAAMAGAPVSNMTSAYGGIRWGSGLNRMFQYEHTQSRIGTTLWENRDLYIENSPIFFADKVTTPLLIMHNDDDGAVPWYQGIELASALRRLDKPSWLLNYNGDGHNLMKRPNRVDLSIRMRQFFDHYLKGKTAPVWLKDGMPALDKGRVSGYDPAE